ncbi:hypothetical protein PS850_04514 [Pseudomonas fluorescens]|nr:hypothetical protein PS850_04514 [Pseudomonas fluorescens]
MNSNKQDFINYLNESRRVVEQWPTWKQESLKAAQGSSRSPSSPPREREKN